MITSLNNVSNHSYENKHSFLIEKDRYLRVDNCGFSTAHDDFHRPSGCSTYMLNLVTAGSLKYNTTDLAEETTLSTATNNNVILYRPLDTQHMTNTSPDMFRYWIHFSGYGVEEILSACNLDAGRFFTITNTQNLKSLFDKIWQERLSNDEYKKLRCSAYLMELLTEIAAQHHASPSVNNTNLLITPALKYIKSNYKKDINIDYLADMCNLSKYYFIRIFNKSTGISPYNYLINVRIQCAIYLLIGTNMPISSIAEAVGYNDPLHFSRQFKKSTDYSPLQYRKIKLQEKNY